MDRLGGFLLHEAPLQLEQEIARLLAPFGEKPRTQALQLGGSASGYAGVSAAVQQRTNAGRESAGVKRLRHVGVTPRIDGLLFIAGLRGCHHQQGARLFVLFQSTGKFQPVHAW